MRRHIILIVLFLCNFVCSNRIEAQSLLQQAKKQASASRKTASADNSKKHTISQGTTSSSKKNTAKKMTSSAKKRQSSTNQSTNNDLHETKEEEDNDGFDAAFIAYELYKLRDFEKIKQSIESQNIYPFTKLVDNGTFAKYIRNNKRKETLVIRRANTDTPYCNYIEMDLGKNSQYEIQRKLGLLGFMTDNPQKVITKDGDMEIKFQHSNETLKVVIWTSSDGSKQSLIIVPSIASTWQEYFKFISTLVKKNDVEQICEWLNSLCWYHNEGKGNLWEKRKKVVYKSPDGVLSMTIKKKNKKSTTLGEIEIRLDEKNAYDIDNWIVQAGFRKTGENVNQKGVLGGTYDFRNYVGTNTKISFTTQRNAVSGSSETNNYITFKPF